MIYTYISTFYVPRLHEEIKAQALLNTKYLHVTFLSSDTNIVFSVALSVEEKEALDLIVANHIASPTTAQQMRTMLDTNIFPFVNDVITTFAAENISMGITQLGKTGRLLALFTKNYDVLADGFQYSLKDCFDTGSLYEAIRVIQYLRDNPSEFSGLSPFVTDQRLQKMKNDIERQLGTPLT